MFDLSTLTATQRKRVASALLATIMGLVAVRDAQPEADSKDIDNEIMQYIILHTKFATDSEE